MVASSSEYMLTWNQLRVEAKMLTKTYVLAAFYLALMQLPASANTFYFFPGQPSGGGGPEAQLTVSNGVIYGTTAIGGTFNRGTVFSIVATQPQTALVTVLHNFQGPDGDAPKGQLLAMGNYLYGTTQGGGAYTGGTVFRLPITGGTLQTLHSFNPATEGFMPEGALASVGSDLYGTTRVGGAGSQCPNTTSYNSCGTVFHVSICQGGGFSTLYSFKGPNFNDGGTPYSGVTYWFDGSTGWLYGTTSHGGQNYPTCTTAGRCGTVFRVSLSGSESVLHSFKGGADGDNPYNTGGLAINGTYLYGTTYYGGLGVGTVFRELLTGPGEQVIFQFHGNDGEFPAGTPIVYTWPTGANTQWLYGTTTSGGPSSSCTYPPGCGIVYRMKLNGNTPSLSLAFQGGSGDGGHPYSGLAFWQDPSHHDWLYGTTQEGGPASCQNALGCGAMFRLNP